MAIPGYEYISCSRPKFNKKAKRHSGGVIVYYKEKIRNLVELVELNYNGIIWIKLKRQLFRNDRDIFLCCCYIPPEGSNVYKNVNSSLYDFDFFEKLSTDVGKYRIHGDVYLTGDFNARVGVKADYVNNENLDRYVDLPDTDFPMHSVKPRMSKDFTVNTFGNKLLTLCKENSLLIANGR